MKVKKSITLSNDILKAIDRNKKTFRSRSELLKVATRGFLAYLARMNAERCDLEIIDRHCAALNKEAGDVLEYSENRPTTSC